MQETIREAAKAVSRSVLTELAPPAEVEISLFYLEPLIEMADRGEVQPIDVADHSGGFGSTDLLAVSVVPAVVQVLKALDATGGTRAEIEETMRTTRPERDRLLVRVGSSRASELRELEATITEALFQRLEPRTAR